MRSMASALFGVLATVGGVPIIRALQGGPTQMISEQLSKVRPAAEKSLFVPIMFPHGLTNLSIPSFQNIPY